MKRHLTLVVTGPLSINNYCITDSHFHYFYIMNPLNILIVDDDEIPGPVVRDYLEMQNITATLIHDSTQVANIHSPRTCGSYHRVTKQLSAIESSLLLLFCESRNGTIERETALKKIWKDEDMFRQVIKPALHTYNNMS